LLLDGERLRQISRFGARSWTGTDSDGLDAVVAAERQCCPFLSLTFDQGDGELVLTIDAGPEGGPIAAELARAFASA
jgi:hypothetical protein